LALLDRQLAASPAGLPPPLLLFAGEPGIGKSRLLQEAMARAPDHGWRVLHGGCQRRGGQEPYAPLLGALERHLSRLQPAQRRGDLQGCAWLVRLLPELAGTVGAELPATPLAPEQERRLLFRAVGRFLTNVAGPSGTLLLLDDLQWAGGDALDLLGTLVRADSTAPLRVIGAYRDSEVDPRDPLAVLLADLAHAGLAGHSVLRPLSDEDVRGLLDQAWPATGDPGESELRERVRQRAGGVPFFVLSCAQALCVREGDAEDVDAVPWDVAQSVRHRVAALPEAAQEVLRAAAVAGRELPPALLTRATALPERAVLAALDAAAQARLLVAEEQAYRFAHDVITSAWRGARPCTAAWPRPWSDSRAGRRSSAWPTTTGVATHPSASSRTWSRRAMRRGTNRHARRRPPTTRSWSSDWSGGDAWPRRRGCARNWAACCTVPGSTRRRWRYSKERPRRIARRATWTVWAR
jgi:predicted ATPase